MSESHDFNRAGLSGKLSHISSCEEVRTLFKSKTNTIETDEDTSEQHAQCHSIKTIIKYTIGISVLIGGLYSTLKSTNSNNVVNNNASKLINDSKINSLVTVFNTAYETTEIAPLNRKSRYIHAHKNHPYNYYYSKKQSAECKQQDFLEKCRKEHQRMDKEKKHYTQLVLNIGLTPCICPPPENRNVNIISPLIDYTYTEDQHPDCKSKKLLKGCQEYHRGLQKKKKTHVKILTFSFKNNYCHCPPLNGALVNVIPPKQEENYISDNEVVIQNNKGNITAILTQAEDRFITHKNKRILLNSEKKHTIEDEKDNVTIKKMYDFSCLTEREDITFGKVLSIISETLSHPITSLSSESAIVHEYNILHLGCPSLNTMKNINDIASVADQFLSVFTQVVPGFKSIMIVQNIISPILMAISQDLDGKDIDVNLINEINSNIIFIFQDSVRSMSLSDMKKIGLMTAQDMKKHTSDSFKNKFKISSNGLSVFYRDVYSKLSFDVKDRPYIVLDGKTIFVGYNINNNKWEQLNSDYLNFYSDENAYNVKKYSVDDVYRNDLSNIDNLNELVKVEKWLSTDEVTFDHVFVGDKLIPVYKIILSSGEDTYVTAVIDLPKKIIVRTPYGFVFDKESTSISYVLSLYIESNMNGESLGEVNIYSKIHDDKLSYDVDSKPYLKYRDRYYPVYLYDKENNIYSMSSDNNNDEVYIKIKGSGFDFYKHTFFNIQDLFKQDPSLLSKILDGDFDGFANTFSIVPLISDGQYSGYIDFHTYAKLLTSGEVLSPHVMKLEKIDSLTYRDKTSNDYFLNINDRFYSIEKNVGSDRLIVVKNKNINKNNIEIYHHDDLLIQRGEERYQSEYLRLMGCKVKKDITDVSCMPVYICEALKRKLDNNLDGGYSFSVSDGDIKASDSHPGFFYRKGKGFYYYKGSFFEVKINLSNTEWNKFPEPIIDIYTRSIFNSKRKITSFIVVSKKERIELKEPNVYLSENTGRKVDDMQFLLDNKKYYNIPNVFEINNSINEVNRAKQLKIIAPKEHPDIKIEHKAIVDYCYKSFYDGKYDIKFTILEMDKITSDYNESVLLDRLNIELHLRNAREIVTKAIGFVTKPSNNLNEYIKTILNTDSKKITRQFLKHLRIAFELILLKLDSKFIYLVSAIKEPYENEQLSNLNTNVKSPVHYKRVLDDTSLRSGAFAFTTKIKDTHIYICTDKFYLLDPTHPDRAMHHVNEIDLTETLIHEASHAGYGTDDSYYMDHEFDGALGSLMKSKDKFINKIPKRKDIYHDALIKTTKEYVERISLYERWKEKLLNDKNALSFFISHDIGIMANIYLKNADFLTKICTDIYRINIEDKYDSNFYSNFLDVGNILSAPVIGFLDRDEGEVIPDISAVDSSLPLSSGQITPLDTINEEEETATADHKALKQYPLFYHASSITRG